MSEVYLNCHIEEKRSFDVSISAIFFILLFPFSSHATCTPTPDCASIGYTETSCETQSVKCPFDTSKLFCIPCDSSFKYDCNEEPSLAGIGASCNNKFAACECIKGAISVEGNCTCDNSCSVGNIYYGDGSCSSCVYSNKTPVGVVIKDNELIITLIMADMLWSADQVNVTNLPNIDSSTTALNDTSGQENTNIIVNHYGEDIDRSTNAGVFCYTQSPTGLPSSKGQWYLPALGELYNYVYPNFTTIKNTWNMLGISLPDYYIWSSTKHTQWSSWTVNVGDGSLIGRNLVNNSSVTCFMSIK